MAQTKQPEGAWAVESLTNHVFLVQGKTGETKSDLNGGGEPYSLRPDLA